MQHRQKVRAPDGTELSAWVHGPAAAPCVVLCDGFGCDGFIWRHLRQTLSQHYRVISWHYRGHGQSGRPQATGQLGMAVMCADLGAVLDAFGVGRAVLVGHSMGVQLILQAALTYPQRLVALVPICGSYGQPLMTLRRFGLAQKLFPLLQACVRHFPSGSRQLWRAAMRSPLMHAYARRFEVNGAALQPGDLDAYFAHLAAMDPHIFVGMLGQLKDHSVEAQLGSIHLPTLIIAASRDSFTPAWLSQRMQQRMPHAELLEIAAASHVAPLEFPQLIQARLDQFLRAQWAAAASGAALPPPPSAALGKVAAAAP